MRLKALLFGLVVGLFGCLGAMPTLAQEQVAQEQVVQEEVAPEEGAPEQVAQEQDAQEPAAQEQGEDVRGAFMTTRPKPADKSAKGYENSRPNRRRPKTVQAKSATAGVSVTASVSTKEAAPAKATPQKLGLGLTLLTRDSLGLTVRADPTRYFRKGDRVRVLLETNADGYLYIFNTTNGGKPVMIYPDRELDEGGNYIKAHIPFEIPSSTASEERLRWLVFDQNAGTERLYFVFSRDPLPGIPIEDDLIAYCADSKNQCPIQPNVELWIKVEKDLDSPLHVAAVAKYGKAQTAPEREAVERGIGLSKEEPPPSLIMMSASVNSGILVTVLELFHK